MLHGEKESLSRTAKLLEIKEEMVLMPIFKKDLLFQQGRATRNITGIVLTCRFA
jgi:hypothetical protein